MTDNMTMTDLDDPDALTALFAGQAPADRISLCAELVDRLDVLRTAVTAGTLDATPVQAAALDGALVVLRAILTT